VRIGRILKWTAGALVVFAFVVGSAAVFLVPRIQEVMEQRASAAGGKQVVVEAAARDSLTRYVSAPGTIAPNAFANISSRVSAKIEEMPFDEGDTVNKGEILVRLESRELEASLAAARARFLADKASAKSAEAQLVSEESRVIGAKASYENAVAEYERQQELFTSGDISQADLDRARTEMDRLKAAYDAQVAALETLRANVDAARARAEASKADVDRAQRNLEYATITAPFDGIITQRNLNVGEVALGTISNQGATIMVLEDQTEMLVEARLAELDAPKVDEGQPVSCYVSGFPDKTFRGVVKRVGRRALRWSADNTLYFEAEIVIDTEGMPVKSGTTANVDIEIETIDDVLVVPSQAVQDKRVDSLPQRIREENTIVDREKTFVRVVFLMRDGKAIMTPVDTISSNLVYTAVDRGIDTGDLVVVGPFAVLQDLAHDDAIRVRGTGEDEGAEPDSTAVAEGEGDEEGEDEQTEETASGDSTSRSVPATASTAG